LLKSPEWTATTAGVYIVRLSLSSFPDATEILEETGREGGEGEGLVCA